jgi:hypothetical protein
VGRQDAPQRFDNGGHHLTAAEVREARLRLAAEMLSLVAQEGTGLPRPTRHALTKLVAALAALREAVGAHP